MGNKHLRQLIKNKLSARHVNKNKNKNNINNFNRLHSVPSINNQTVFPEYDLGKFEFTTPTLNSISTVLSHHVSNSDQIFVKVKCEATADQIFQYIKKFVVIDTFNELDNYELCLEVKSAEKSKNDAKKNEKTKIVKLNDEVPILEQSSLTDYGQSMVIEAGTIKLKIDHDNVRIVITVISLQHADDCEENFILPPAKKCAQLLQNRTRTVNDNIIPVRRLEQEEMPNQLLELLKAQTLNESRVANSYNGNITEMDIENKPMNFSLQSIAKENEKDDYKADDKWPFSSNNIKQHFSESVEQLHNSFKNNSNYSQQRHFENNHFGDEATVKWPFKNTIFHIKNQQIQLWEFLLELLANAEYTDYIQWTENKDEFKILDPDQIAALWGKRKGKPKMDYDKLSRALRFYYKSNIIEKVLKHNFCYKFVCDIKKITGFDSAELKQLSTLNNLQI